MFSTTKRQDYLKMKEMNELSGGIVNSDQSSA